MQLLSIILSFAVLASARPSPSYGNEMEAITGSQIAVGAPCNTGQRYCFGQIVTDLGMSLLSLPSHHITHALPCSSRPFHTAFCVGNAILTIPRHGHARPTPPVLRPTIQSRRAFMPRLHQVSQPDARLRRSLPGLEFCVYLQGKQRIHFFASVRQLVLGWRMYRETISSRGERSKGRCDRSWSSRGGLVSG
jgi:hypothetical protein